MSWCLTNERGGFIFLNQESRRPKENRFRSLLLQRERTRNLLKAKIARFFYGISHFDYWIFQLLLFKSLLRVGGMKCGDGFVEFSIITWRCV
jgi:hypothetical protein